MNLQRFETLLGVAKERRIHDGFVGPHLVELLAHSVDGDVDQVRELVDQGKWADLNKLIPKKPENIPDKPVEDMNGNEPIDRLSEIEYRLSLMEVRLEEMESQIGLPGSRWIHR
jgi:hypothetical protein